MPIMGQHVTAKRAVVECSVLVEKQESHALHGATQEDLVRTVVAMLSRSTIVSNILSYVHLSTNLLISHHLLVPCLLHTLQSSTRLYLLSQLATAKVAVVVNGVLV